MSRFTGLCFAALLALSSQATVASAADFAGDFSSSTNPSSNWSYGTSATLGGPLVLLTDITTYVGVVDAWNPSGTFWPTVALNRGAATVAFGAGDAIVLEAGQGLLHPGPTGAFADVRYTASTAFSGILNVSFAGIDRAGTTTDVHVLRNGVSLTSGLVNGFGQLVSYNNQISLDAGDYLDFVVGWGSNGNYIDDSTGFRASLTSAAPEPASWALMIGGLGMIGVALRRRTTAQV